jgi:Winged helix-turn helix
MMLLAADGMPNAEIARTVGVSRPTVIGRRDRYEQGGITALDDEPRPGRPAEIHEIQVMVATLADDGLPPDRPGITRWSGRRPRSARRLARPRHSCCPEMRCRALRTARARELSAVLDLVLNIGDGFRRGHAVPGGVE